MFSKTARRKHALRQLQQASEQIQLPWLCPFLYRPPKPRIQTRPISHRPSAPSSPIAALRSQSPRRLASAAASPDLLQPSQYLNYDLSLDSQPSSSVALSSGLSELSPYDPSQLLLLDDTVAEPPERLLSNRINGIQIRGNAQEVKTTLDACLQVRRFDRAFALLRQLQIILHPHSDSLRDVFNDFLQAMVMDMIINNDKKNISVINQWVEVDMLKAGVEPDARTYALKVKVALATMTGSKRDRTVRRYWELARQGERLNEVASLRGILSEQDLGRLSEIAPQTQTDFDLEDYDVCESHRLPVEQPVVSHPEVEQIRATDQKGLGLLSLRKSMSLFSKKPHFENQTDINSQTYARARQIRLEADSVEAAVERWRTEQREMTKQGRNRNFRSPRLGALLWNWHQEVRRKLVEELELVEAAESVTRKNDREKLRCEYGPFLRLLDPEKLAALVTITTIGAIDKRGVQAPLRLARIVTSVGRMVEAEVQVAHKRQSTQQKKGSKAHAQDHQQVGDAVANPADATGSEDSPIPVASAYTTGVGSLTYGRPRFRWSAATHARVGAVLCEMLFDAANLSVEKKDPETLRMLHVSQPAFTRTELFEQGRRVSVVTMHSELVEKLMHEPAGNILAKHLPMVCEPTPWTDFETGGFLANQTSFLRVKGGELSQRDYAEAASARGDLDQVFAGIDVLGKTGWKINQPVFHVMVKAWNSGDAIANLPPINKVFSMPEKPVGVHEKEEYVRWYRAVKRIENEKFGLHSNRCFQNFQMEIAKAFLHETFYLPHNVDFRGRAYPIPPYLNQMGADNCRGLLLFANGRELGEQGLRWVKIHLSNVFGYDKASLKDRENFPMEHLADVLDSANNPLDGRRWWLNAEDPWQCLAACSELKQAMDCPDPTKYISHLPVHQDGSCNGLQHYAALGGDIAGAKQVNLEPGDKPSDIYSGVAELVKAEISQDAKQGDEMAKLVDGRVTRKIVKQTVMTNVYGVTFVGAIRQVKRQLDVLMPDLKAGAVPKSALAATYIARKIFKALGAMFSGAHDIQYWLGDCATKISTSISPAQLRRILEADDNADVEMPAAEGPKVRGRKKLKAMSMPAIASFRSSVIWTTPLRLPVVQPYRIRSTRRVHTNLQDVTLIEPTVTDAVDKRKQLQAFPPNFIHSLDATHMLLSALKCHEVGLTFSAVHDSFWTHAADINTLGRLLRDSFIRMHSEDIIGRLAAEFRTRYKDHMYLASISSISELGKRIISLRSELHRGNLNARDVRGRQYNELILEARRTNLLRSSDPVEQQRGRDLVTPCSLFEALDGDKHLQTRNSLGETAIGAIPEQTERAIVEEALKSEATAGDVDMESTLDPLDVPSEAQDVLKKRQTAKETKQARSSTWLWLPLTFKPVPQKGEFDVHRLRDSQYFFS